MFLRVLWIIGVKMGDLSLDSGWIFLLLHPASEEGQHWEREGIGERKKLQEIWKKICEEEKDFYLCSPKQNGSYQTEFVNDKKKIEKR